MGAILSAFTSLLVGAIAILVKGLFVFWIIVAILAILPWTWNWIVAAGEWAIGEFFGDLPVAESLQMEWLGPLASALEAWLPFSQFVGMVIVLKAYDWAFLLSKMRFKLIPHVG